MDNFQSTHRAPLSHQDILAVPIASSAGDLIAGQCCHHRVIFHQSAMFEHIDGAIGSGECSMGNSRLSHELSFARASVELPVFYGKRSKLEGSLKSTVRFLLRR